MYKHTAKALLASLLLMSASSVVSASLKDQPVVFKAGKWEVRKSVDPMTDKVSCTGIYGKQLGYQLNDDSLYLKVRGSLRSVTMRYGDNKPENLRLATDMEERISFIIIDGGAFRKLSTVNRLRTESLTYLGTLDRKDLNLTGMDKVIAFIKAGCKAVHSNKPQAPQPDASKPKAPAKGEHTHGDRSHSHPLPAEGVKHRHGGGKIGR